MTANHFTYDTRLGIHLPDLKQEWEELSLEEQHEIIAEWERIKAKIPDRIIELECEINQRQDRVSKEDDWDTVCRLYKEIYTIASMINDLNVWARLDQELDPSSGMAKEHTSREK